MAFRIKDGGRFSGIKDGGRFSGIKDGGRFSVLMIEDAEPSPVFTFIYLDGLGNDPQGNAIVFVLVKSKDKAASDRVLGRYLIRYDKQLTPTMIDYIELGEGYNLNEQINRFRTTVR